MSIPARYFRVDQLINTWVFEVQVDGQTVYILEDGDHSALVIGPLADSVATVNYLCGWGCDKTARKTLELISTFPPFPRPLFQLHEFSHKVRGCRGLARLLVKHRTESGSETTVPIKLADGSVFKPNPYTRNFHYLFFVKEVFDIALCADKDNDILDLQTVLEDFAAGLETSSYISVAEQWTNFANTDKPGTPCYNFATFAAAAFSSVDPLSSQLRREKKLVRGVNTFMSICCGPSISGPSASMSGLSVSFTNTLVSLGESPALLRVPFFLEMQKLGEYTSSTKSSWIEDSRVKELDNPSRLIWLCDMLLCIVGRIEVQMNGRDVESLERKRDSATNELEYRREIEYQLRHTEKLKMWALRNLRELDDNLIHLNRLLER